MRVRNGTGLDGEKIVGFLFPSLGSRLTFLDSPSLCQDSLSLPVIHSVLSPPFINSDSVLARSVVPRHSILSLHSSLPCLTSLRGWEWKERERTWHRLTLDLWLARDNRFLNPKSSYKRILMAPSCRFIWLGWSGRESFAPSFFLWLTLHSHTGPSRTEGEEKGRDGE